MIGVVEIRILTSLSHLPQKLPLIKYLYSLHLGIVKGNTRLISIVILHEDL